MSGRGQAARGAPAGMGAGARAPAHRGAGGYRVGGKAEKETPPWPMRTGAPSAIAPERPPFARAAAGAGGGAATPAGRGAAAPGAACAAGTRERADERAGAGQRGWRDDA